MSNIREGILVEQFKHGVYPKMVNKKGHTSYCVP